MKMILKLLLSAQKKHFRVIELSKLSRSCMTSFATVQFQFFCSYSFSLSLLKMLLYRGNMLNYVRFGSLSTKVVYAAPIILVNVACTS